MEPGSLSTARPLPVRDLGLALDDDIPLLWNERLPELAAAANGISLLLPHVEPLLCRTIRGAREQLGEPLRSRADEFVRQELAHHVQHRRFNEVLTGHCPRLARVDRVARRTFAWIERRSPAFRVAFAAGSEALAFGIARWADRNARPIFDGAHPEATRLLLWHLAEEVEHKSVAYEVFAATGGSRLRLLAATSLSLVLLVGFTYWSCFSMLRTERRLRLPVTWFRLARWSVSLAFTLLPVAGSALLPGHHPSHLSDPAFLVQWLRSEAVPRSPAA